jgi:uncharacterized peroxidase-related enzyme
VNPGPPGAQEPFNSSPIGSAEAGTLAQAVEIARKKRRGAKPKTEKSMTFKIHSIQSAPEESRENLEKADSKFGFIPNTLRVFAGAPAVLDAFMDMDGLMEKTSLSVTERHIVFLAVSARNECEYCMAAHTRGAEAGGVPENVIQSLRGNTPIDDEKLEAFRQYVLGVMDNHGRPSDSVKERFIAAGYGPRQALEIVLGISLKTLTNYTNRLAHPPLDDAFKGMAWDVKRAA